MPLLSKTKVINLKLNSLPLPLLKEFASRFGVSKNKNAGQIIKILLEEPRTDLEQEIDQFIKEKYVKLLERRRELISDQELKFELMKVRTFSWGVIQGQLDQKIQTEYVRKFIRYDDLIKGINDKLSNEISNYVICTWYNHWTTVLIEEYIALHPKVVPTIKNVKGVDIFFDGQPFDIKITYLPQNYEPTDALSNPKKLAVWMYENQGIQRFGEDNRFFLILLDKKNPNESWKLKRDFDFIFQKVDNFFNTERVTVEDEVVFTFKRKTYNPVAKVLIITK